MQQSALTQLPPATTQRSWPVWLALFVTFTLAILAGLLALFTWQKQQQLQQSLVSAADLTRRVDDRQLQTSQAIEGRLKTLDQQLTQQQAQLARQARQIEQTASSLLEAGHRNRTDWLLGEAEYLLRIANQRLQLERDVAGTLAILQSADSVLLESDDPSLFVVRQQIARDIQALDSIAPVDIDGLYLQLDAAIHWLDEMPGASLRQDVGQQGTQAIAADAGGAAREGGAASARQWQQIWFKIKAAFSQAVQIRRLDQPVKPLLTPDESAYVVMNLRLMLEQAQLGLLRGRQALYNQALTRAQGWIGQYYDTSHPSVVSLQKTLAQLSRHPVQTQLPDISHSLRLLKGRLSGSPTAQEEPARPTTPPATRSEGVHTP